MLQCATSSRRYGTAHEPVHPYQYVFVYIYPYIHWYTHAHPHTHLHTRTLRRSRLVGACLQFKIHQTHIADIAIQTRIHKRTFTRLHVCIIHTHIHICIHIYTYTHTGAADTSVRVWSPKAAKCTLTLRGHTTAVTNVWCDDQVHCF